MFIVYMFIVTMFVYCLHVCLYICLLFTCLFIYLFTGLYMDAEASMEFLLSRRDIDKRKIIVFGRSLGGAVAIYLAASITYSDK